MRPDAFDLDARLLTTLVDDVPVARRLQSTAPSAAPTVSVVMPAYNEELRLLPTLLSRLAYFEARGLSHELIIVDDGSEDATAAVVQAVARRCRSVRLISLPANMGKGAAVRTGIRNATGSYVLIDDADGATPIAEFAALQSAVDAGAEIAIGSRALRAAHTRVDRKLRRWAVGRVFARLVNLWVVPGIADTQCGFKLFRGDVARRLFALQQLDGFAFDVEVLRLAAVLHCQVAEVPINWGDVDGSKVDVVRDSMRMLWDVARIPRLVQRAVADDADFATPSTHAQPARAGHSPAPLAPRQDLG